MIPGVTVGISAAAAIVLVVVGVLLAVYLAMPVRTYFQTQSDRAAEVSRSERLQRENEDLRHQEALQQDPGYLEQQARDRLQFVYPGDYPYRIQFPPAPVASPEEVAQQRSEQNPWYTNLWETIATPRG